MNTGDLTNSRTRKMTGLATFSATSSTILWGPHQAGHYAILGSAHEVTRRMTEGAIIAATYALTRKPPDSGPLSITR